jgi:XRE family transcriptional regulator, master regulator for biofilm formation
MYMIGNIIKENRLKKGLSLTKLAECAGVERSYLSSIENNICMNPSIEILEKITPVLEISSESLLFIGSLHTYDPIWNDIVTEALETGLTTDEYLAFLKSTNNQNNPELGQLTAPISNDINLYQNLQKKRDNHQLSLIS